MKYLLSTSRTTSDVITYIKDCILIELKLLENEVPYSDIGTQDFLEDVDTSKLHDLIQSAATEVTKKLSILFSDIKIELGSVTINGGLVDILIYINEIPAHYELKRVY